MGPRGITGIDRSWPITTQLGIGLYSVPEAARLTGIPQARLRRWLRGYTYAPADAQPASQPVWQR